MNELIYNLAVWLDETEWSRMLHESYYMYNWVESTHVLTLMVSLGMLFLIDLRMLGLALPDVPASRIAERLNVPMLIGFAVMFITGILLFYAVPVRTSQSLWFRIKMALLVACAVNAFLFHTSDPSYTFMLVLATNRPGDLDAAVLDRVDEAVEIPLPDEGAREKLLHLYFAMAFDRPAPSTRLGRLLDRILKRFRAPDVCIALDRKRAIRALAKKTEGYSGRECSKLMLSVQGAVYATERRASGELVLDDELWHRTVRWKLEEVKPRAAKAVADLRVAVE